MTTADKRNLTTSNSGLTPPPQASKLKDGHLAHNQDKDVPEESPGESTPRGYGIASPRTMKGRKIYHRATDGTFVAPHLRVVAQDEDDHNEDCATALLPIPSSPVVFSAVSHVYKQKKREAGQCARYTDRGSLLLKGHADGWLVGYNRQTGRVHLNAMVLRAGADVLGSTIGPTKKKHQDASIFVMLKDHALIQEGELRAFYLAFECAWEMTNFIMFFVKSSKLTGKDSPSVLPGSDAGLEDKCSKADLESSFDSQNSDLSDLIPGSLNKSHDSEVSKESQQSELSEESLLPQSQDPFGDNIIYRGERCVSHVPSPQFTPDKQQGGEK